MHGFTLPGQGFEVSAAGAVGPAPGGSLPPESSGSPRHRGCLLSPPHGPLLTPLHFPLVFGLVFCFALAARGRCLRGWPVLPAQGVCIGEDTDVGPKELSFQVERGQPDSGAGRDCPTDDKIN